MSCLPYSATQKVFRRQIGNVIQTRDLLLPKLVSGEIDIALAGERTKELARI